MDMVSCAWLCVNAKCARIGVLKYVQMRALIIKRRPNLKMFMMVVGLTGKGGRSRNAKRPIPSRPPCMTVFSMLCVPITRVAGVISCALLHSIAQDHKGVTRQKNFNVSTLLERQSSASPSVFQSDLLLTRTCKKDSPARVHRAAQCFHLQPPIAP